jgi:hypothetical protein
MNYRNLTKEERELINRIISYQPLAKPIGLTLAYADRARVLFPDGTLEFEGNRMELHDQERYYPVEAQFFDIDGVPVNALVFYIGNKLSLLEIVKADGSEISRHPRPEEWEIIDLSY